MIAEHLLFRSEGGFIRIPVWGHIPLTGPMKQVISNPSFLRLKGIRQLSFAQQVYPGATHTRFEHSIGVYHLMKLILQKMLTNPLALELQDDRFRFEEGSCALLLAASLLHDIGHYPHAHVIEGQIYTASGEEVFPHHEELCHHFIHERHPGQPSIATILEDRWGVDADAVVNLIVKGPGNHFGKLISGTLDPDKMDYLMRDAHHCNIPYGNIDIERLIESFVPDPERERFAITQKGIAPLESLLFAKYMMMRNVYWHHTSRTLSAMLRRLLEDITERELLPLETLRRLFYDNADDRILHELKALLGKASQGIAILLEEIITRRVYKRAITLRPYHGDNTADGQWFSYATDSRKRKAMEQEICRHLNGRFGLSLKGNEILIDPPSKKDVFDYDDLRELRVHPTRNGQHPITAGQQNRPVRFDDMEESVFRSDFILSFERYTKKFRILCRQDLQEKVEASRAEIVAMLAKR